MGTLGCKQWEGHTVAEASAQPTPSILISVGVKTITKHPSGLSGILTQHHSNTTVLVFILKVNMTIYKPGDIQNDKP